MSRKLRSACPGMCFVVGSSLVYSSRGWSGLGRRCLADVARHGRPASRSQRRPARRRPPVGRLFTALSDKQKEMICFPFEHELRQKISANWHITKPSIESDFYSKDQQVLIDEIVRKVTSPDGYERIQKQTEYDDGGIGSYSIAIFGTPGSGKFQWALTGRHLTLRADGDSVDKAAFGGPIIYGHGEEDPKENLFHYQTKQANEVFRALDAKQAQQALLQNAAGGSGGQLARRTGKIPGHRHRRTERRSEAARRSDPQDPAVAVPLGRRRRSHVDSEGQRRSRQTAHGVLPARGSERRQGVGHLARGRTFLRLAFPRSTPRARVHQYRAKEITRADSRSSVSPIA